MYMPAGMICTVARTLTDQPLARQQQFLRDDRTDSDWTGGDASRAAALDPEVHVTYWQHNALAQQTLRIDAAGNRLAQTYDIGGQLLASALQPAGQSDARVVRSAIVYAADGQVLSETAGNGTVTSNGYEPQTRRLTTLHCSRPAQSGRQSAVQALRYDHDPAGNLLAIADDTQTARFFGNRRIDAGYRYAYDALYQLSQANGRENANASRQTAALPSPMVPPVADDSLLTTYTRTYDYDRGGNLIAIHHHGSQSYTLEMVVSGHSNRAMPQTGGLTPADVNGGFDDCGNLLALQPGLPLTWNTRNQLQRTIQVHRDGGNDDHEDYWYDSQGHRAMKRTVTMTGGTIRSRRIRYLPGLRLHQTVQSVDGTDTLIESL